MIYVGVLAVVVTSEQCPKRVSQPKAPDGLTVEAAMMHPTWRLWQMPGARCTLEAKHDGPHRTAAVGQAALVWHDPPLLIIGESGAEPVGAGAASGGEEIFGSESASDDSQTSENRYPPFEVWSDPFEGLF